MERAELRSLAEASGCAVPAGDAVFLCDPAWSAASVAQFTRQRELADRRPAGEQGGWLCVATGGTSGGLKFARHDEATLAAAATGLARHFGLGRINAVDVLPAHHVSGLMARVRAAATGGTHLPWDWKRLEAGEFPALAPRGDGWVISLVPTQLQRLLPRPAAVEWLRRMRAVFLGGGPLWPDLAEAAARARLPLAPGYGMTETAAMVAALPPELFLGGDRTCGPALPHARLTVAEDAAIRVGGLSLFRGYWPEWRTERELRTEDRGRLDANGHLRVLGRRDEVIITGGKKVDPAGVEAALRASGELADVAVVGVPDAEWGEVVVACRPRTEGVEPDLGRAGAALAPHERPKRWVVVDPWPRNAQGKLNRAALRAAAQA